jgi:hypothetical protein
VDSVAPFPDAARALYYSNELRSNALSKTALATTRIPPLRCSGHDPLDSSAPPLPLAQRNGNLQSDTTSSSTTLASNAHERSDRIDSESEIEYRVEWKVRWRWRAGEQRSRGVNGGDR